LKKISGKEIFKNKPFLVHNFLAKVQASWLISWLELLSNNCSVKQEFSPSYCTGNLLQKACEKFEFWSNNCSAKTAHFSILLYRQYASKSLWKVWILVKQFFGKKGLFFLFFAYLLIVQAICFRKPVENFNSCQAIVRRKRLIFPYYCTGNMPQKACGKFEFLSNKCFSKKAYFSILLYRQNASKSLWKLWILVKQLFGKTGLFFYIQAVCFKKLVESLNSCQKKIRQKRLIFPHYCTGIVQTIFKKIDCGSK
jgi:hypothetical protein